MASLTKGQMIKDLKRMGIREAVKSETNELVAIEHIKTHQIIEIWTDAVEKGVTGPVAHDSEYFTVGE